MLPPPSPDVALFLDVDGTLVDIAPRPEDVRTGAALVHLLARVAGRLGGAVALVSGRPLAGLESLFAPLQLPAAGLHGLERRTADGRVVRAAYDAAAFVAARERLDAFVRRHPGLRLEDKGAAVAVHFRGAPALEHEVARVFESLAGELGPEFHVQPGLLVRELKPSAADKGTALAAFMAESPFAGRIPVAVGDDLTDLDAFRAAGALGGYGVAVGDRVAARWQLPGPRALRAWLARLAE